MKSEKQLYQWDVNQYLTELQPTAEFVDYPIGNEVIRIKADGTRCRIPDEVLQTYGGKTCYERYPDGTYRAYSFTVLYAPKPPDYIYTTEERTTFEALTARVDAAIEEIKRRADSGEFTPVARWRSASPCWRKCCRSRSQPQKKMINGMPPCRWFFRCKNSRREVIPCECT